MGRFGAHVLLLSILLQWIVKSKGQNADLLLTLDPPPTEMGDQYKAPHNKSFRVACTVISNSNQKVFVYWRRTDGSESSLIKDNGPNETDASASGESSGGSGNASFISSASGSASGSGSSYYSGGSASGQHEVSAFLQVSDQDGGIQCSDAGQYECVAGVDTRTESISINVTVTGICCQEEISSGGNTYTWPETISNTTVIFICPNSTNFSVSRECIVEGGWQDFDQEGCGVLAQYLNSLLVIASDNLTNETLSEHVAVLSRVVMQSEGREVDQHTDNLNKIADIFSTISNHVTESNMMLHKDTVTDVVQTVNSLLQWTPDAVEVNSSSSIVKSFEEVISEYAQQIPENSTQTLNFTSLTLIAERINIETLKKTGRRFSAGDIPPTTGGSTSSPEQLTNEENVAIYLPPSLFEKTGDVGMFFGIYKTATLFPVTEALNSSVGRQEQVFSNILAATVGQNLNISNLDQPITIAFRTQPSEVMITDPDSRRCVSWDFGFHKWTSQGCNTSSDSDGIVVCRCSHLTNFAVVVDVCVRQEDCQQSTTTEPPTTVIDKLRGLNTSFTNLTSDNYVDAVSGLTEVIEQSENNEDDQTSENLGTVADYFSKVATFFTESGVVVNIIAVEGAAQVVSSLLQWNPENVVVQSSSRVVRSFETILSVSAQQLPLNEENSINVPSLSIRAERRTVEDLIKKGRSFTIGDDKALLGAEGDVRPGELPPEKEASIILPGSLFLHVDDRSDIGSFYGLFDSTNLFPIRGGNTDNQANATRVTKLGSSILSATVGDESVSFENLHEAVSVTLRLNFNDSDFIVPGSEKCVTWDFEIQDWTERGCTTEISEDKQFATCTCNHLTNFCVLVDICLRQEDCETSKVDSVLTYISYIGMPISIASLVLTIITLLSFKSIRQKDVSKYHIQLCLALLLMLIVSLAFVVLSAEDITALYGGCALVSILVHYFALASMLWMGAEALLMFQKLVLVFVQITTKYIVILSLACWTVPVVPVFIPLVVDLAVDDHIITHTGPNVSYEFCFLSHPGAFWGAFLAPLLAIIVFNAVIFVCVIVVLIKHVKTSAELKNRSISKEEATRLIFSISGVMSLFGLTWLFAILTFSTEGLRETFQILFTLFNSFQGLFIFLFVCVMSSDVRDEWKGLFKIKVQPPPIKQQFDRKPNPNTSNTKSTTLPLTSTSSDSSTWLKNKDKEAKENKLNLNVSTMIDADVFDDEVKERDPQDMISDSQEKAQEVESRKEGAQSEEEKSIDALTDDVFDDEKKEKDPQEMMSDSQEKAQEDESSKEGAQLEEEKTYEENPTSNTSD